MLSMGSYYIVTVNSYCEHLTDIPLHRASTESSCDCFFTKIDLSNSNITCLLHNDVRFNVEEKVIVVSPDLQQQGCLLLQCLLQVSCGHQRSAIQFHNNVTIFDTTSGGKDRNEKKSFYFT